MALSGFNIIRASMTTGGFNSLQFRSLNAQQSISYKVQAIDDGNQPLLRPEQVTENDVIKDDRLPKVNENVFYWTKDYLAQTQDPAEAYVMPWLRCLNKRAERDPSNPWIWEVKCDFGMQQHFDVIEEDFYQLTIPADVSGYPFLKETVYGEEYRVIYEDVKTANKLDLRLPTGSLYAEPFRRRHPRRTIRQWQFEDLPSTPEQAVEERLFTLCSDTLAIFGDPDPDEDGEPNPPRWMMQNIEYQRVALPRDNAGAIEVFNAYLMVYTMERNSKDGGWLDRRGLVDNYFLRTANDLTTKDTFRDEAGGQTIIPGLITSTGVKKTSQSGTPDFLNYRTQPYLSWDFLRT